MKTVIITGSNKGIGLETALIFGRAGYKVLATMRNLNNAEELKEKIKTENLQISIYEMDVNSDTSVKNCIKTIILENKKVDIIINNAGIERHGSVEDMDLSEFKEIMETNYFGVLRCVKEIVPHMRLNKSGQIINIASVAGKISNSPLGGYAASKFALEAISEALAQELKPFNIKVTIIEPGIIDTKMARDIKNNRKSIYQQSNRFGGLFAASLKNPTTPSYAANEILKVVDSNTWELRHPVGPDAKPFIEWRASLTDEEWINWHAANDEYWYNSVETSFGLNARINN
jgi:NAD(P)-dependent dehydrogenase (short-subunit alcohol dehydrogenase family)